MEISIVILNYKTPRLLRQCLKGIFAFPPSVSYEVLVVDNGSRDTTADVLKKEFPQVKFYPLTKNVGYAKGSNVGIRKAVGKYILLLNADVVVLAGSLDHLYEAMQLDGKVAAGGPCLKNPDGSMQESAYGFHTFFTPLYQRTLLGKTSRGKKEIERFLMKSWNHQSERSVGWLMSSCLMLRREALAALRGFDERFFVYMADTDLCRRLWLNGWKVKYFPQSTCVHYHRRQSANDLWAMRIHAQDWLRYLWKWRGQKEPTIDVQ